MSALERSTCESIAVLGGEIAGLENLAASSVASCHSLASSEDYLRVQLSDERSQAGEQQARLESTNSQLVDQVRGLETELTEARARLHVSSEQRP